MRTSRRAARGRLFVAAAILLVLASACSGLSQAQGPLPASLSGESPSGTSSSVGNPTGTAPAITGAAINSATPALLPQAGAQVTAAPGSALQMPQVTPSLPPSSTQGSAPAIVSSNTGAAGAGGPAPSPALAQPQAQTLPAVPSPAAASGQTAPPDQPTLAAVGQGNESPSSLPGAQYVSPLPGSAYNPPGTTIALRYGNTLDATDVHAGFTVAGTSSGEHNGSVALSDDQKTLIFKPDQPFTAGETVQVGVSSWKEASGADHPALSFQFTVATDITKPGSTTGSIVLQDSQPLPDGYVPAGPQGPYVTLPADFPAIAVTVPATNTAPGDIFASNFQLYPGPSGYYLMILDNSGEPVYYQKLAANTRVLDFKPLPDGTLSYADDARNAFVIMDNTYHEIKTLTPGNGYQWFDEHDLQLLPNGHYLMMANEVRTMDLSKVVPGGSPQAQVTSQVLQEIDRSQNVVFQWRALDYNPIQDTTESLISNTVDFSHANSIALDNDGNILLSMRHLDEVVKIDRNTGAVMWRLGGKENEFTFSAGPGVAGPVNFYHQHDVRMLPNGHLTVFDNHNGHDPQVSRALEYALDETGKTATLVWAWQTTPTDYAVAMGNVQRLDNGDTLIGWGTNGFPNIDEVAPDGTKVFEIDFAGWDVTYRAFRAQWHGYPTWSPALVGQVNGNNLKLTFSWNGATEVSAYRILSGNTSPPTDVVAQQPKAGFETSYTIQNAQGAACFYQVVPVDNQGKDGVPSGVLTNPARTDCGQGH